MTRPPPGGKISALAQDRQPPTHSKERVNVPNQVSVGRVRHPHPLVQRRRRHAQPARPGTGTGRKTDRARGPDADFPHEPDRAGSIGGALDSHPRAGARSLPPLAPLAAVPRPPAGSGPGHPGQDLLQVRRRLPGRLAQGQHLHRPGLLQPRGGHQAHRHRNRRRPMGFLDGPGRADVRPGSAGVHGEGQLRAEALPPLHDADLGRRSVRQPEHGNQRRPRRPGGRPEQSGLAGPGDFRSGGGRRLARRHQLRAGLGAEPRAAAPDRDRPGSQEAVRKGRRLPGHDLRPLRRRLQLRRRGLPLLRRQGGGQERAPGGGRTRPPARPSPAAITPTISATPPSSRR